ncbi:MAG: YCF48-related protein [Gammaproteobacteria bacterium]|nr:YCF48-related protein [Gammaproteobacteria bacterium]
MRELATFGCLAVASIGLGAQAQPAGDGLFRDVESPYSEVAPSPADQPAEDPRDHPGNVLRTRLVRVDVRALATAREDLLLPDRDPKRLNLFDDVGFEVVFDTSVPAVSGYALQGRLVGVESGTVTFVVRGQNVTGTVTSSTARYTITPVGVGVHAVSEVDWTLAPEGVPIPPEDSPSGTPDETLESTAPRARQPPADAPASPPNPLPRSAPRPLPTINPNAWQPQGPGAAGRPGGLVDGQVENVEPNNAVIGAVHAVLAHPTDADILYIGATNGGVWKTTNARATNPDWTPLTDDMNALSIGAMEFDPNDPETILVGIGRYSSFYRAGSDRNGLYLTQDGGASWTKLDDPVVLDMNISGLAIDGDRLVVAGNSFTVPTGHRGVARSEDGGETWSVVTEDDGLPGDGVFDMVVDPSNRDRLYASVIGNGIFRSDDGGTTWTHASEHDEAIQAVMTHGFNNNGEMAVAHDGRLYLAAMIGGQAQYIGHTDDQGGTWTAMDLPLTPESDGDIEGLNPRFKAGAQGYIHFSIRVDPAHADIVYVGGDRQDSPFPNFIGAGNYTGRLFRGNASVEATGDAPSPQWEHLTHSAFIAQIPGGGTANHSAPHADSREMVFDADGDLIQVDDGGIYRRTSPRENTGDWFSLNGNLQVTEMHDIAYDTLANVIVSGNQDVGNSQQSAGASLYWDTLTEGDGGDVVIDVREAEGRSIRYLSHQYFARFTGHIYDASNERIGLLAPALLVNGAIHLQDWDPNLQFVQRFELNTVNPNRAVIGASSLYESYDQFETLEEAFVPDRDADRFDQVRATAYGCPDNPGLLYVGHGSYTDGARVSVRAGEPGDFVETGYPGGITVELLIDPDCSAVYAIDANDVWMSNDTGATWEWVTENLVGVPVRYRDLRNLEFVPAGEIFADAAIAVAGRGGVQVMEVTSPGEWHDLGSGLPDAPVLDLDYDLDSRLLVAGTLGRGAWFILSAAPVILIGVADQNMEVDDESTLDISNLFHSMDDMLTYTASSTDPSVVDVSLTGTDLTISANRAGAVTVTVIATDSAGLTGTYAFTTTVGTVVSFAAQAEEVTEGGMVSLAIDLNRSSSTAIDVGYSIMPGDAAGTASADSVDHTGAAGTLSFAAGVTSQSVEITVNDDDDIEPVREAFTILLDSPAEGATWGLGLIPAATVRIKEGVCDRTPAVRDALSPRVDCSEVTESQIGSVRDLELEKIDSFNSRDFLGLSGLARLKIVDGKFTSLPEGLFDGLANLVTLDMTGNALESLPETLFDDLARLKILNLHDNELTGLPEAVFQGAGALEHLSTARNALATLPARVFDGLNGLKVLRLDENALAELPAGLFDPLAELNILDLAENGLSALPDGIFDTLAEMNALRLDNNELAALPADLFDGSDQLGLLQLGDNQLTELPADVLDGLRVLARLYLDGNQLAALPVGVFEGVESLHLLHLHDNPGAPFMFPMAAVRTDSEDPGAPSPATLVARVGAGAPFPMSGRVVVANGSTTAGALRIAPGSLDSEAFTVEEDNGKAIVRITDVAPQPAHDCGPVMCFQGVGTAEGEPLAIFEGPELVERIRDQVLESSGDRRVFDLSDAFSAEPGTVLVFSVVSSDAALVAASLDGSMLTITAGEGADEGEATVTVTATDDLGRVATLVFDVALGVMSPGWRGWRLKMLLDALGAADDGGSEDGEAD